VDIPQPTYYRWFSPFLQAIGKRRYSSFWQKEKSHRQL